MRMQEAQEGFAVYTASVVFVCFIGICIFVSVSCPFIYSVIHCLTVFIYPL